MKPRALRASANCFVRAAPSAAAAPLGVAKRGSRLTCAAGKSADGWLAVDWRGETGWVSGRFIKCEA